MAFKVPELRILLGKLSFTRLDLRSMSNMVWVFIWCLTRWFIILDCAHGISQWLKSKRRYQVNSSTIANDDYIYPVKYFAVSLSFIFAVSLPLIFAVPLPLIFAVSYPLIFIVSYPLIFVVPLSQFLCLSLSLSLINTMSLPLVISAIYSPANVSTLDSFQNASIPPDSFRTK